MKAKYFTLGALCMLGIATQAQTEASVVWPFNDAENYSAYTATPSDGFAEVTVTIADEDSITGTGTRSSEPKLYLYDENGDSTEVTFIKIQPVYGSATDEVVWSVKPAEGYTFTPTLVSGYIQRFGTDSENGVTVYGQVLNDSTTKTQLGNYTAPRANRPNEENGDDKYADNENYTSYFEIELTEEQQEAFTSTEGFALSATIGVGNSKQGGFSEIHIEGVLEEEVEEVYENEEASVIWPFNDVDNYAAYTATPSDGFAEAVFDICNCTAGSRKIDEITFITLTATAETDTVTWFVKPADGLEFTPTSVSANVRRGATDNYSGITISAMLTDGTQETLGNVIARRYNRVVVAADSTETVDNAVQNGYTVVDSFDIELTEEQQEAFTSTEGFYLVCTTGVGSGKWGAFNDVRINGLLNTVSSPETGINNVSVSADNEGVYNVYSLSGVRVMSTTNSATLNSLSSGIYIINGKKVVMK